MLSLDPPMLAIYSDMTMRPDASHPAITVQSFTPSKLSSPVVKVGDRLVVATFYEPGNEKMPEQRWKRLCATTTIREVTRNPQDIQRTFNSIDEEDWKKLDAGARRATAPFKETIYYLETGRKDGGTDVSEGRVLLTAADDPEMEKIKMLGRKTFRFFLRENYWEQNRIVPGLDLAAVKIAFSDPPEIRSQHPADLEVEYMWISDVRFDGKKITGTLLNEPDSLQSVAAGDSVSASTSQIVDWIYSQIGEVCGGFTVQKMRLGMEKRELKQHDKAWGLDFGKPGAVRLIPTNDLPEAVRDKRVSVPDVEGIYIVGDYKLIDRQEHPMSINMRESLEQTLKDNPDFMSSEDKSGLSLIHQLVIAGSLDEVDVCLKQGADPNLAAANGMTPGKLAKLLGWKKLQERLKQAGAEF